jgi:hypothetical protein
VTRKTFQSLQPGDRIIATVDTKQIICLVSGHAVRDKIAAKPHRHRCPGWMTRTRSIRRTDVRAISARRPSIEDVEARQMSFEELFA